MKFHNIIISVTEVAPQSDVKTLSVAMHTLTQAWKLSNTRKKAALTDFALKDGMVTCTCFKIFHLPKSMPHEHPIYFICPFSLMI